MMHAVKAMAITAAQPVDDPTLHAQAKVEFEERSGDFTYTAAIPDGAEPPKPHT
jgi:hypothetical protein